MQKIDFFYLLNFIKLRDELVISKYQQLNIDIAKEQIAGLADKYYYGYDTIYNILYRIPFFWSTVPLLWLLKITIIGQFFYLELAMKRQIIKIHCNEQSCTN